MNFVLKKEQNYVTPVSSLHIVDNSYLSSRLYDVISEEFELAITREMHEDEQILHRRHRKSKAIAKTKGPSISDGRNSRVNFYKHYANKLARYNYESGKGNNYRKAQRYLQEYIHMI